MPSVVNVATNPPTQRTAGDHVRQVMLVSREPRDTDRGRDSVRRELHGATIVILIRDHRCDCPRLGRVSGRKRTAAVEKFTTFATVERPPPLRNAFEHTFDDETVNHRFGTQQSGFARAIVVRLAAEEIKAARHRSQTVSGTEIANVTAQCDLTIRFADLVAGHAIRRYQRHPTDTRRNQPLRVAAIEMKRSGPDRLLVAKDILDEVVLE